ncbi:MAG TPA: serine hydrolase domain-containing protein [Stellaceae bacterium]|nr:serine hydrolase domain-containing protein [Stellaceae bacterium]
MSALGLPRAESPDHVGLSSRRLERLADVVRRDVEKKVIPGAVVAIARGGRVGFAQAFGFRDRDAGTEMTLDSIFRIASMTKPMTTLAAMMLAKEGRLEIAAPVASYLPEFAEMTVGVERKKATRTMTVQDLLRHTSGLTYSDFGDSPVQMIWRDAGLRDENQTNADLTAKLGKLPLMFEPGTTWEYSMSTDVLGRVVEVASGKALGDFVAEHIAGPLGMVDTGFAASGARAGRVAEPQADPLTGKRPPMRNVKQPGRLQSGGGGAVSTAADYLRFCQMLLNGGELDGVRLLAPKTVAVMASDHLAPDIAYSATTRSRFGALAPVPEMGHGFGLGFAVRTAQGRSPVPGSVGDFFWGGALGTYFWIDPQEQMIAVLMAASPDQRLHYRYLTRQLVYAALTRSRSQRWR